MKFYDDTKHTRTVGKQERSVYWRAAVAGLSVVVAQSKNTIFFFFTSFSVFILPIIMSLLT